MKIRNVVATANLYQYIDVTKFIEYSWGIYDLECYGGRCGYVKDDHIPGRVTVFLSGKMISIGGKSIPESVQQLEYTKGILIREKFIKEISLEPKVQNVVATVDVKSKIDLNKMSSTFTGFSFIPEQFPAGIYKSLVGPTCLIFASGKIVIAGAKSEEEITATENSLLNLLNQFLFDKNGGISLAKTC